MAAMKIPPAVSACSGTLRATHADQVTGTGPTIAPHNKMRTVVAEADPPNAKKSTPDTESTSGRMMSARRRCFLISIPAKAASHGPRLIGAAAGHWKQHQYAGIQSQRYPQHGREAAIDSQ